MGRNEFADTVIDTLENAVRGRQILVIGSPFSGKTEFLNTIKKRASIRQRNWIVYDSGKAEDLFSESFYRNLLIVLKNEGCVNGDFFLDGKILSLNSFFKKIGKALHKESIRHLIVLVDNLNEGQLSIEKISNLLSTIRGFYSEWADIEINIHFVFTGWVNTYSLLNVFRGADGASWPFLKNKTIFLLPNLTFDEIKRQISSKIEANPIFEDIYSQYLFELTYGDKYTLECLLRIIEDSNYSCQSFYNGAERLVNDNRWLNSIEQFSKQLSVNAYEVLIRNLRGQLVKLPDPQLMEELLLSGLFKECEQNCICLLNPIIERTLRSRWDRFFPSKKGVIFKDGNELIPPIFTLNKKAFDLIFMIETQLRNLVVVRLGVLNPNGQKHFLSGLNQVKNTYTEQNEDQYFRSIDWQRRVSKSRYVDTHAALISYTDTRDILILIDYLIENKDVVVFPLTKIRPHLSGLKEIRDAVMHGQVITEETVKKLLVINRELNQSLTTFLD